MQHQDQDNQHDQLIQTIHQFKKRQQQRINYFQQIQEHLLKMTNNHNSPLSSSLPSLIIGSQQQQQQQRQAPSPPPPPPTPPPPPSPPPPQREFRARKPNQVKPFTIETKAYINKLYHNGWEDAVVKNPKLKNHRTDPPSPALSINSNQSEQQERSDSSEIELPQLSQLCPRKFHNKPTQLNSKHHNQPHHRRAQSSDPQSPSARKNNPSLRTTTTTHIQQTPPIIRFPSTSTLINTPSQQSLPSPLPPSPSIIFQSNPPSPLQSTSRKRTTSLQNQPNPKRHSRHRSPQSRAPREPGDPSDNQSNDLSNQHSNRRSFSANTIKPSNRGKSKATVVNPSKGSTRAKIRSRSDDDQRRDQDREEEDENEEEEEELDQLLTLRKKDLKIMNRMMPRAAALKAHDDMILMFREDRTQKLRKTIHSDSHHQQPQAQPQQKKQRATSARSLSPPEESTTGYSPDHQRTQQEPNGMNWGKRMRMRISRSSSSTSQLLNSSRTLERSTSHSSSVTSNPSSRTTRAVSQSSRTNRLNRAISLRDDHALWRTYESANGRPALNLPPPAWRQHSVVDDKTEIELTQVPIWDFKDFTSDFGISRLPANLMITSQVNYLSDGHISELISLLDSSSLYATIEPVEIFETSFSGFMTLEEWQQPLSSVADRIQDELSAWLAEDSGRSKNALSETGRWFKFMGRSINSVGFDDRLVEPMLDWIEDLLARIDDLAVDAVNRPEFSNLMLVTSWGIFELVVRLGLHCRRRPLDSTRSPQTLLEFGHRSLSNLLRRLLEYGPPVTMGKLKAYSSDDDRESPLFDISVEVWAALLNIILTPIDDGSKAEYLLIDSFWTKVIDNTQIHAQQIELSQIACGEAVSYLSMMLCAISQILPSGQTTEAGRMKAHWPVLVVSLGKIPETILGEMLEVRMRERRDRYVRSLFARILVFHERWDWELCFDDGMVERLYKILNAGRFERLSIELPEMNQRFGPVDRFPHLLDDIDPDELKQIPSSEDLAFRLSTKMRTDDSCFGIFLKILIVGFKALPRPIEASKQKEIEKIISRCNPLRQLSFKPSRDLGPTDPKITEQNRTSLVNHCALFLIYSILFPNTLKRQWSFLCNLYSFASIDHPARSTHFKILCHFAKFLKPPLSSTGIVQRFGQFEYLKIILKKFSENLTLLKLEYSKLKERESMIQGRLFGSSTVSSGGASTTASSKDIFKKDSAEHVTLRVELKEISEAINSRVQLVTQIFDSLFDIFSFYSHDLSRQDHSLIYPPLFWLDSSWSVGIEESILMREKLVICGFNKLVYALLDRRKMKMAQVVEDERRVEAIEVRIGEACRVVAADREELADDELVLQKSELKEQIEAVYALDQEFVERAVSVLPGPLTKSIQSLILDRHQGALDEHQLGFFPVGVQSIRLLGCIDRLKAALDPGFNWLENFRSVERQLGEFGASRPSNPPQSKGKTVSNNGLKKRNEIKMMTVAMSGLMSYLIGNLAGYFEEATHLSQPREASSSSSKTMTALTRIYRGQVRLEVLKVWIDSLTFIEYSLQLPFSNLIIHLENDLSVLLASHPGQPNDELYGTFVPSVDDWNCWLVLNRILEPADRAHLGPEWSLDKELDFVFNLCSSDRASATLTLESKRIEVFELIFGEMKKQLIHLTRGPTEGGEKIEMEKYVELYKEIIGRFAESISTMNRRLVVFIASSTDADHLRLKVGLENLVMTWKTSVKSIFHNFLPLNNRPDSAPHNPDQSGLHLDQFFNFDSFPKLRILKSILGIV